uniref:protein-tyrosine-phosphatase n=1 Tax=Haemonchus contortus TaxID=6289 RepID=A0A7I5E890_HAECO
MKIALVVLAASFQLVRSSSILVDWSSTTVAESIAYVLDYAPAVGNPPAGSSLNSSARQALITDTIPACEYTVYLSAIMPDGKRRHVTKKTIYSSPLPPILDSIETGEHEATVSYFPPKEANITFHIEYYPEGNREYANVIETKATLVRLRGLDSGTAFRIKIRSVYNGVLSPDMIESVFRTSGAAEYDYENLEETFTIRTLPPGFDLATTTATKELSESDDYLYSAEDLDDEDSSTTSTPELTAVTSVPSSLEAITSTTTIFTEDTPQQSTSTLSLSSSTTEKSSSVSTTILTSTTNAPAIETTTTGLTSTVVVTEALSKQTTTEARGDEEVDTNDDQREAHHLLSAKQMAAEFGQPSWISMSDEENMIRLNWTVPDGSLCDAVLVNYTVVTLTRPKSYSVATMDDYLLIKFFANHTLDLRVFCMLAGSVSKTWWAHRIVQLTNPQPVEGVRIISSETDEFYVSRISIDWDWPAFHNPDLYHVIISYSINGGTETEIEITESEQKPFVLDKLEPTQLYRISVRNESLELGLSSKVVQLERMTPPIISSMISPGKISSTSININFGDSDFEQGRFDYYELIFTGNNKNITQKIQVNEEKSFTFTKLIPGKTYLFTLYTIYKGTRSRPVTEAITTYPLKVNALYPVVGRDYVVLYWDIENYADSDCRFRLSYNAERVATVSVELKGASRHRFGPLMSDIYYTFTITVIMGTGKAAAESESEMITVYLPREGRSLPSLKRQGSRELTVKFENDQQMFSQLNGAIEDVAVIVSDDIDMNDDNYELKSWFDVKDEETWGSYRASPSGWNPFKKSSKEASFTIGSDDCVRRSLDDPYCNGILRASVPYKVKVRAYMDTKVAMESEWITADGEVDDDEEEDKNDRRLPCHMYLNGCPRKSGTVRNLSTTFTAVIFFFLVRVQ